MKKRVSICGVIVTFNRAEKLVKVLKAYSEQSYKPACVIVVNNCSTDNTPTILSEWQRNREPFEKIVHNLPENTGGAGGFSKGMEIASSLGYDWVFIGDDDAYPSTDLFEKFSKRPELADSSIGAIATRVDSPDGVSYAHRRRVFKGLITFKEKASKPRDYLLDSFGVDLFSFVGVFLKNEYVVNVGMPNKSYFIWYDDSEYSYRFTKLYRAVCVPELSSFHDCAKESIAFCWKSYYGYRNKLHMLKTDVGFAQYHIFGFLLWCSSLLDTIAGKKAKGRVKRKAIRDAKENKMGKNADFLPNKFLG